MFDTGSPPTPDLTRRGWLGLVSAAGLAGLGCGRQRDVSLVVATTWPKADRTGLERLLRPRRTAWIGPTGGDDPTWLISRGLRADFVLGGPLSSYQRLAEEGLLASPWVVGRKEPLGLAVRPGPDVPTTGRGPDGLSRWQLPDPRRDPVSLAWCRAVLEQGAWADGYARLVRAVSRAVGPEVPLGSPQVQSFPSVASRVRHDPGLTFVAVDSPAAQWFEGAAVVRGTRREEAAYRLLSVFQAQFPRASEPTAPDPRESGLLADLLGSVLVEARHELIEARRAIDTHPDRAAARKAEHWMVQPPPWPPASVLVLREKPDASSLVGGLAEQVVHDPRTRLWLLESWVRPEAPVDGGLLAQLARAENGRLAREHHFRAWLRGEWSAWAAQRFRRARRLALGFEPTPKPGGPRA